MNQLQQSPMLLERMSFAILDITNAWFLQPTFQWLDCTKNIWVAGSPTNVGSCLESWHSLHHVWHCPMLQYYHLLATQRRHHHLIVSAAHAASDPGLCCYCLGNARKIQQHLQSSTSILNTSVFSTCKQAYSIHHVKSAWNDILH